MSASQTTMDKLYGMRLSVMAQAYRDQEEMLSVADMTFDERFAMIVDADGTRDASTSGPACCARRPSPTRRPTSSTSATTPTASSTR